MSDKDANDICTDGACATEAPVTQFSSDMDNLQTELSSSMNPKMLPTVTDGNTSPTITISKKNYEYLCAELKSKEQKLKALKNIHLLIQEKDEEVSSLKEKNQTYADALMMSEVRHCQLLRMATRFTKESASSNLDQKHKTSSINDSAKQMSDSSESNEMPSLHNSEMDQPRVSAKQTLPKDSEIQNSEGNAVELNEETAQEKTSLETDEVSFQSNLPLAGFTCTNLEPNLKESDLAVNRDATGDAVQKTTEQEDRVESMQQQVLKPRALPVPTHVQPRKFPGVSQDLVSKLIQQNARLKLVLRQIMNSRGIGVEDYLERQEYVSVVEQLRQELKLSQSRVKHLEELVASTGNQDTDGLRKHNLQLQEMLQRQNKILAVKQAMIDAFSKRCEELEHQLKQLKLQSLMEVESSFSRKPQETAASDKMATKTFAANTFSQRPQSPSSSHKGLDMDGATDELQEQVTEKNDAITHAPLVTSSAVVCGLHIASSLICERCDREFPESDKEKYREHCTKCTDD